MLSDGQLHVSELPVPVWPTVQNVHEALVLLYVYTLVTYFRFPAMLWPNMPLTVLEYVVTPNTPLNGTTGLEMRLQPDSKYMVQLKNEPPYVGKEVQVLVLGA